MIISKILRLNASVMCCGLVLLLAACAATPPRRQVAVNLPEVWRAPLPPAGSTAALVDWWNALPDPIFIELIERARTTNPDLQIAAARHQQARALVTQIRANLLPQTGIDATSSQGRGLNNEGTVFTQLDTRFNASCEIDLFGGQRAAADGQAAQALATLHYWLADRLREAESVAREREGIAHRPPLPAYASLRRGPQRVVSQRNALTAHSDLLTAQADQAQAWFRLYRSLGGGWNAEPSPAEQLVLQP